MRRIRLLSIILVALVTLPALRAGNFENFKVAVYCRAYEVARMGDLEWLEPLWNDLTKQVHVDKIYLETHRDLLIVDRETMETAIEFFKSRGVEVAGGITYTVNESNNFETFCYSNPEHRQKVKEIAEYTAGFFDEMILDDFFFTSCKCDLCIAAKGERSWTQFRLELMKQAALELVINPAKAVNPDVEVVIKYPNWYEHFQGLGFNLEAQPALFDGVYTGTETRNRDGNQHLQQYHGYTVFRYFENLKPGQNRGGWVDTGGGNPLDRYAEQFWVTMFAKAPEITLFDFRQMILPINERGRAAWQGTGTSFDFDQMKKPLLQDDGNLFTPKNMSRAAGYSLEVVDKVLGALGNPVAIKSYKPYHSIGEDYLQSYLGMIGIPMDIVPEFPEDEEMVLLTESAKYDPRIVEKIKSQLQRGKEVTITSGLCKALQGKGIEDIVELTVTGRKANVKQFRAGWGMPMESDHEMIIPQISYLTNDSWEVISALDDTNGWPILHRADYSEGRLYILTVPDNFIDLYQMPEGVLNQLRQNIAGSLGTVLEGPGEVGLFMYDNNAFVVESFLDETVTVHVTVDPVITEVTDVMTGEKIQGTQRLAPEFRGRKFGKDVNVIELEVKPHSFRAFSH
ncbi:MAG: hypothetical protein V2B15_01230 [Bacteroidota bacterium]